MRVRELLCDKGHDVYTTGPHSRLGVIAAAMRRRGIGSAVVIDGDLLLGVVAERDIVDAVARDGARGLERLAIEVAHNHDVTCRLDDELIEVMATMTERRVRHVPVVHEGRLAGIVSIGDVVKHRLAEIEDEARNLRDYIALAR